MLIDLLCLRFNHNEYYVHTIAAKFTGIRREKQEALDVLFRLYRARDITVRVFYQESDRIQRYMRQPTES